MSRPRKKVKVFNVPREEMISVTRVSLGDGNQVVTQMPLLVPSQDCTVKPTPTLLTSANEAASANNTTESQSKQRYVSSVSLAFSVLCRLFFCFAVFCVFVFAFL